MRVVILLCTALLCWTGSVVAQSYPSVSEYRVDFPYTNPGTHRLKTWIFESEQRDGPPGMVEAGILAALATTINSGQLTLLSVSIRFTKEGYITGATAVTVEAPGARGSPVRLLIVYHDTATKEFFASPQFQELLETWTDARKRGRSYDELKVQRGPGTGVETLITYFCTAAPCPGKYPIVALR